VPAVEPGQADPKGRIWYRTKTGSFGITRPIDGKAATHARLRRRDFISLVGGSAVAWPLAARAQQPPLPVIGFLHSGSPKPNAAITSALRRKE
jgi:hypothetical protein